MPGVFRSIKGDPKARPASAMVAPCKLTDTAANCREVSQGCESSVSRAEDSSSVRYRSPWAAARTAAQRQRQAQVCVVRSLTTAWNAGWRRYALTAPSLYVDIVD